ncbi:MAG: hypothetical protein KAU38_08920, partial [Desulfobacterales bacterium]|nr:hypothetical protein [Desulfobacterales bacterium]
DIDIAVDDILFGQADVFKTPCLDFLWGIVLGNWPVSELSTPKWTKVEATFSCGLSQLRLTYLFTVSI